MDNQTNSTQLRMEKDEDQIMIFVLLVIIGFMVCKACSIMADYIDHQEAERKRFYTALENDLERLARMIKETKNRKAEEPKMILIKKEWAGRN